MQVKAIYHAVLDNNIDNFKDGLKRLEIPMNQVYMNRLEKMSLLHFLGSLN